MKSMKGTKDMKNPDWRTGTGVNGQHRRWALTAGTTLTAEALEGG